MTEKGTVVLTKEQLAIQKLRQKPMMERKKKFQEAKRKRTNESMNPALTRRAGTLFIQNSLGIVQQSKTQ